MKHISFKVILVFTLIVGVISCETYLDFDPTSAVNSDTVGDNGDGNNDNSGGGNNGGGNGNGNGNGTGNGGAITTELSENDPQQTGSCDDFDSRSFINLVDLIEIPDSLPESYDLSELMPPVRSQGSQGSCVSWATAYYLKSYQEKVQYGYEYETFDDVMSPAFVYNQSANGNCGAGSTIGGALEILQTQGVTSWAEFPYDDQICSEQPTTNQLALAEQNKIGDYFVVEVSDTITDPNYTKINLMRTLLTQDTPVLMSFSIKEVNFSFQNTVNNDFIGLTFTPDPTVVCGHAVLIVGYDDTLEAFKFVNSWGTFWGNEGYAWLSYNFFLPPEDSNFVEGVSGTFIAYDKEEDEI